MLTRREYSNLWDRFGNLNRNLQVPSYGDYVARENMLEDYLDIFSGRNTRNEREAHTVPYPHPYFNTLGEPLVRPTPKIKYILIGEAAPPTKSAKISQP